MRKMHSRNICIEILDLLNFKNVCFLISLSNSFPSPSLSVQKETRLYCQKSTSN